MDVEIASDRREAAVHDDRDIEARDAEPASDLEYDLAHESTAGGTDLADPGPGHEPSVYVATQTNDYDGDYGYDLAHDVPGR
jgi:hypothetical protein